MCGLLAVFSLRRTAPLNREDVDAARDIMAPRGPDAAATLDIAGENEARHWLAHRRLSIQDLSSMAEQPMSSASGRCSIVYNGEVYNTSALRAELEAKGVKFKTTSDTEVILEGYELWGQQVVDKLNGIFAFAIWDRRDQSAFLARDRIGIKPLYVAHTQDGLACASDLRALRALGYGQGVDTEAKALFFMLGYVPAPRTIWSGIEKLPAGTTLRWHADGSVSKKTYWSAPEDTDFEDGEIELSDLIDTVVEEQLLSDVPVGLFLSGGLDSSVIAASIANLGPGVAQNIDALTVAYPGSASGDEAPIARRTADQLGMNIRVLPVRTASHLGYEAAVKVLDEPLAYNAVVSQVVISKLASEAGLKVVLSGDGGDEVFGGYRWYGDLAENGFQPFGNPDQIWSLKSLTPRGYRKYRDKSLGHLHRSKSRLNMHLQRVFPAFRPDQVERLLPEISAVACEELLHSSLSGYLAPRLPEKRQLQRLDLYTFCQDVVLPKVDRAGMAFGVEARPPLLDHRIIEWGLSRPISESFDSAPKNQLRQIVRNRGLGFLLDEPKRGFSLKLAAGPDAKLRAATIDQQSLGISKSWRKVVRYAEVSSIKLDTLHFLSLWHQTQEQHP